MNQRPIHITITIHNRIILLTGCQDKIIENCRMKFLNLCGFIIIPCFLFPYALDDHGMEYNHGFHRHDEKAGFSFRHDLYFRSWLYINHFKNGQLPLIGLYSFLKTFFRVIPVALQHGKEPGYTISTGIANIESGVVLKERNALPGLQFRKMNLNRMGRRKATRLRGKTLSRVICNG